MTHSVVYEWDNLSKFDGKFLSLQFIFFLHVNATNDKRRQLAEQRHKTKPMKVELCLCINFLIIAAGRHSSDDVVDSFQALHDFRIEGRRSTMRGCNL